MHGSRQEDRRSQGLWRARKGRRKTGQGQSPGVGQGAGQGIGERDTERGLGDCRKEKGDGIWRERLTDRGKGKSDHKVTTKGEKREIVIADWKERMGILQNRPGKDTNIDSTCRLDHIATRARSTRTFRREGGRDTEAGQSTNRRRRHQKEGKKKEKMEEAERKEDHKAHHDASRKARSTYMSLLCIKTRFSVASRQSFVWPRRCVPSRRC